MYPYASRQVAPLKSCCNLLQSFKENKSRRKTLNSEVHSKDGTLKYQMLLTIQRFDSAVDFSVIKVCEVAVIDGTKMTWRKEGEKKHKVFFSSEFSFR